MKIIVNTVILTKEEAKNIIAQYVSKRLKMKKPKEVVFIVSVGKKKSIREASMRVEVRYHENVV